MKIPYKLKISKLITNYVGYLRAIMLIDCNLDFSVCSFPSLLVKLNVLM